MANSGRVEDYDFEPIFSQVRGFRRIYVDLPGMGATPAQHLRDLDDIFVRLVDFIDTRIGTLHFLLIGSSCGGYLARALAQKYAAQVDGLLLRVPLIEPDDSKRDVGAFQPLVRDETLMASMPDKDKAYLGNVLIKTPAYISSWKARLDDVILPAVKSSAKEVLDPIRKDEQRYRLSYPVGDIRSKFVAPALVISGRQDESVGYRDTLPLLEIYSRSTFAVLDRSVHPQPIDEHDREVFDALVRDWIFRVNEWRSSSQTR